MSIFSSLTKSLTQGGQNWFHQLRMTSQVFVKLGQYVVSGWCLLTLAVGWLLTGTEAVLNSVNVSLAYLYHWLGADSLQLAFRYQGQRGIETVQQVLQEPYYTLLLRQVLSRFEVVACVTAVISVGVYSMIAYTLTQKGKRLTEDQFLRGIKVVPPKQLAKQVKRTMGVSDIFLDGMSLPKDFEVRHVLLHGTTGAGKSQAIMKLLTAIRRRGDKVIIPDAGGVLTRCFYREGNDYLLSPFDQRSHRWECWSEGENWEAYHHISQSLIPLSLREDPFWVTAARSLFSHGLEEMKKDPDRSHTKLLSLLLNAPLKELQRYLSTTDAAMIANQDTEKTTTCIRTLIAAYLKALRLLDRREEAVRYGVVTLNQAPTDSALCLRMEQAREKEEPLTALLVWWQSSEGKLMGRLVQKQQGQLKSVAIPLQAGVKLHNEINQLALKPANYDDGLVLLQGGECAHRRLIEQLHQAVETPSPFAPHFSIRDWVADEGDTNWLFMPYAAHQRHALRPLLSLWLDLACMNLLRRKEHPHQRLWILLDELPTLHRLPSLDAMAEARKFGGCFVLGVQAISQMWEIYGANTTRTLVNLTNTRLFFRSNDSEVANWTSKALGEQTLARCQENVSYGANAMRDGVSLHHQIVNQPAVTAAEVQNLKDLDYYLRLSGDLPVTKGTLRYQSYPLRAEAFQPIHSSSSMQAVDQRISDYERWLPLQRVTDPAPVVNTDQAKPASSEVETTDAPGEQEEEERVSTCNPSQRQQEDRLRGYC